jgi:di/tricarboxylate transporter
MQDLTIAIFSSLTFQFSQRFCSYFITATSNAIMDEKRHTSYILKPEDTASKIPNTIAFIIYRLLPISILSFLVYKTHTEIELDWDQWNKCIGIWDIAIIFYLCGFGYSAKYDYCRLERSGSRQEWVDTLNTKIEKWIQGYGSRLR